MQPRTRAFRTGSLLAGILLGGAAVLVVLFGLRWAKSEADRQQERRRNELGALLRADAVRAARGLTELVSGTRAGRDFPGVEVHGVTWTPQQSPPDEGHIFGDAELAEFVDGDPEAALMRYRALQDGTLTATQRVMALRNVGRLLVGFGEEEEGRLALRNATDVVGASDVESFLAAVELARHDESAREALLAAIVRDRYAGVTPEQRAFVHERLGGAPSEIPGLSVLGAIRGTDQANGVVTISRDRIGWRIDETGGVLRLAVVEQDAILDLVLPDAMDRVLAEDGEDLPEPFPCFSLGASPALHARIDKDRAVAYRGRALLSGAAGAALLLVAGALLLLDRRAAALEARKRHFLAAVTHELKTPLANIRLYAETIGEHGRADPDGAERFAGIIGQEAEKLTGRVATILAVAAGGRPEPDAQQEFDAATVLRQIAAGHRDATRQRGVRIEDDGLSTAPVRGAESFLATALAEIVENAVKFARSRVRIGCEVTGRSVRITVEDDGPGIPRSDRERVFLPFERLDQAHERQVPGTGLGLPLARQGVSGSGGTVCAGVSDLGGALLTVVLPAGG